MTDDPKNAENSVENEIIHRTEVLNSDLCDFSYPCILL